MNGMITDSLKFIFLNLEKFNLTRRFYIDVVLIRKLLWKNKDIKLTVKETFNNFNKFHYPNLKLSRGNQIKNLFSKIDVEIPNEGFIFSIDEYKTLNYENRIIDNISVDYSKILTYSIDDLRQNYLNNNDYSKNQISTLDAIELLVDREIEYLKKSGRNDADKFIKFFENIKTSPVKSFEEALQRILFFNQILWQTGHNLNGFGRLDKVLNDIYDDGISKEDALDLIKDFFKAAHSYFYYKSASLPGDTGQIMVLGGKEPNGEYFSNELTYLFIQAARELNLPDPKIILRYGENMPRDLMELALKCISTGVGSPLISNDEVVIPKLIDFGYDKNDAHNYVVSACWEPAPLKKGFEMNNVGSIIFLKPLNKLLDNGNLDNFKDFDSFLDAYKQYLKDDIENEIDKINSVKWDNDPILSLFIDDCDSSQKDLSQGGAIYNNYGLTSVSLSNAIDSLLNIKKFVFIDEKFSLDEFNRLRTNNFDEESINLLKGQEIRFGVDDEEVINLTNDILKFTGNVFEDFNTIYGGKFKFGLSSPNYIAQAPQIEASFDGRRNSEPFKVHISFDNNQDYTELMRFASKLDYGGCKFNGNVVDFMVSPDFINKNFVKFTDFLILSLKMGVFQMQINVLNSETLIKAKENPQDYPNLIVRVWGFSAYFTDLPADYQDLLIKRALENECKNN